MFRLEIFHGDIADARAVMEAARDWINVNSTLLPDFAINLNFKDTKCNADLMVTQFGEALMSGKKPDLVVGFAW